MDAIKQLQDAQAHLAAATQRLAALTRPANVNQVTKTGVFAAVKTK